MEKWLNDSHSLILIQIHTNKHYGEEKTLGKDW